MIFLDQASDPIFQWSHDKLIFAGKTFSEIITSDFNKKLT